MAGEQFWLQALYFLQRKNTWLWGWTPKSDTQPTENLFVTTWLMSFAQLWMSFLLFCVVVLFTSINVQFGTVYTPQSDSHWFIAHCCRPWLCYLCISGNFNCISSLTVSSLALAPAYPSHWLSSVHTHTHTVRRTETLLPCQNQISAILLVWWVFNWFLSPLRSLLAHSSVQHCLFYPALHWLSVSLDTLIIVCMTGRRDVCESFSFGLFLWIISSQGLS